MQIKRLSDLQKFKSMQRILLTRLWRNGHSSNILLARCKWVLTVLEGSLATLIKTTCTLVIWPRIPLLEIYPKDIPLTVQKYICRTLFLPALFVFPKYCKQSNCLSLGEWLNKLWYIHTTECYTAIKKNKNDLYNLIRNDFQNVQLYEKSNV